MVLAVAVAGFVPRILDRAPRGLPGVAARASGAFSESGDIPAARGIAPDGARADGGPRDGRPPGGGAYWSSWGGSNSREGSLELGPFQAPALLEIPVCGFPRVEGNRLYLEDTVTSEELEVGEGNIGADWVQVRVPVPGAWVGHSVVLRAIDRSSGYYGWLAVGAPRSVPAYAAPWGSFARKLLVFGAVAGAVLLLQSALLRALRALGGIPEPLLALVSLSAVTLLGYADFWVFSASPLAGSVLSWSLLAAAAGAAAWGPDSETGDVRTPLILTAAVGLLYFGLLCLYGSDRTLSDLGAHRFIERLIYDNELPHMFADRLLHGEDSRHLLFGWWLSTDRPPLQTGCDLLLAYPVSCVAGTFEAASQAVGIWMQLLWVSAAWGWLRTLGTSPRASAVVIAALSPASFLLVNTVFAWPKLLSAALLLGAFSLWISFPRDARGPGRRSAVWGSLAGLAFLAHASCAFSLLGWLPFARRHVRVRRASSWLPAAAAFALLALPWSAYQRYYNPPGNTMIKRHLAGVAGYDDRSTSAALVDAYRSSDWATLAGNRLANLRTLFLGPWGDWLAFRTGDLAARREAEYFGLAMTLGWWNLGFAAIAALLVLHLRGQELTRPEGDLLVAVGWSLATLGVWLLLMFSAGSAVVHQCSYACILTLLLCLAWALLNASAFWFLLAAAGCAAVFIQIWLPPNPARIAPLHPEAAACAVAGALILGLAAARAPRSGPGEPSRPAD